QYDFAVGAVAANAARMRALAVEAHGRWGAALVAFPELALCGYPPEDLLLRPSFLEACAHELDALAAGLAGVAAVVGHPHALGEVYNALSLLDGGRVSSTYHKQALPNYTVFDEKRYFRPGHGTLVVSIRGVRIGLLICEDIWQPEPAAHAARAGAELLLVINASPYDVLQAAAREQVLAQRARENGIAIAYVNLVAGQDDLLFDGGSLLVQSDGSIAARAPAFVETLLDCAYDTDTRRLSALEWPAPDATGTAATLYAGLVRGVRDYVRKNGFRSVLLGLSGGIDSALTLAIAVDALGADCVHAVMLPSRHTSALSLREAEAQARGLGVDYQELPIEPAYRAFSGALAPAFAGRAPDATEENLQSRCRGVMLMALSNKFGHLLLSTGNKSEMAVGYATLYGDMCGGYNVLKDVYKMTVFGLARWRNGQSPVIPERIITKPPSAELRPDQKDEDSLPPYKDLDDILHCMIEEEMNVSDITARGHSLETVNRVWKLLDRAEYKRRQACPGVKISRKAFGRDRRYPIVNKFTDIATK
ncbi:MAG: NAD+ synthase, partial [Alphaproteobacteria bacterium]|nr:NAD+ synthase [Alphaproteobacteria bacterium]